MISIKSFLDQRTGNDPEPERDVVEALTQVGRLLVDGIRTHTVRGREGDFDALRQALHALAEQLDVPKSATGLLSSSSHVAEALETHCHRTTEYLREEKDQMQAMVVMLTDTLADVSGQSDVSVVRLHTIEKDLELASGLNDIRAVRSALETCLRALRDTAAQQRSSSTNTVQRLRDHIDMARKRTSGNPKHVPFSRAETDLIAELQDSPGKSAFSSYVAGFKLKRAEHIASRFGEAAAHQMLTTLGALLKAVLGPHDRLLRRKGTAFVMLINSTATIGEIRAQLSDTVAKIGMHPVEVGRKSTLLAVGVDWIVFPQTDHAALAAVLADVDTFLVSDSPEKSSAATRV